MKKKTYGAFAAVLSAAMLIGNTGSAYAWSDAASLTGDDFSVDADDLSTLSDLAPYDYNIADMLYATHPAGGSKFYYYNERTDQDAAGVLTTDRGIVIGDPSERVAEAYGPAMADDTPTDDGLYNTAVSNGWNGVAGVIRSDADYSVSYLYRYQPQWRVGEITFYFDDYDEVCLIAFSTGSWPNQTFLNNRQIARTVQRTLNSMGYSSGTADGVYGPATRNAIMTWQADMGMEEQNGVIDYPLLQELLDEDTLDNLLSDVDIIEPEDENQNQYSGSDQNDESSDEYDDEVNLDEGGSADDATYDLSSQTG